MKIFKILLIAIFSLGLNACFTSEKSEDLVSKKGAGSCVSVEAAAFDKALVNFNVPDGVLGFRINRNGVVFYNSLDQSVNQALDAELTPGQTYRYQCEILVDREVGFQPVGSELKITLPIIEAPDFGGIQKLVVVSPTEVRAEWNYTDEAIISHYKVFKYVGTATDKSDFPNTAYAVVNNPLTLKQLVQNLGDEITYSFRVAACNAADICDDNNIILTETLANTGAPKTTGLTRAEITNGDVYLTAPWTDSDGAIQTRTVYRYNAAIGEACPTTFGTYSEIQNIPISEPNQTPQRFKASGLINENQKYCYLLRDTDPSGNTETNFNIVSVEVGDLTAPEFTSTVTLIRNPSDPEKSLIASWPAIANENEDGLRGAKDYLVYLSSTAAPNTPDADPCSNGSAPAYTVDALPYTNGSQIELNLSNLSARNWVRICVRAEDSSSNLSPQSQMAYTSTADTTPPTFAGIQSLDFNTSTGLFEFAFTAPMESDTTSYKITTIRTRNGIVNSAIVLPKVYSDVAPGQTVTKTFSPTEADVSGNDIILVRVDACDNAAPTFNSQNNCSSTNAEESMPVPDTQPPQGFQGILSAAPGSSHSSVAVTWGAPTTGNWDDYIGFKVHYVDGNGDLTELNSNNCRCLANDCNTNPKTSCEVSQTVLGTFLTPSKNYNFYVEGYDANGNSTRQYITTAIVRSSRTKDSQAPIFNAALSSDNNAGTRVLFDAAEDDQVAGDPEVFVTYEIYRKDNSTFLCPQTPNESVANGCDALSPIASVPEANLSQENGRLFYTDASAQEGNTYYYQVCAKDFAANRICQTGSITSVTVEDQTPPVISALSTSKRAGLTSWQITFNVTDNSTPYNGLILKVYKGTSSYPDPNNLPTTADFTNQSGGGITIDASGNASFTDTGLADVPTAYYHIVAQDIKLNEATAQFQDIEVAPLITSVIKLPEPFFTGEENPVTSEQVVWPQGQTATFAGTNLDQIVAINDATTGISGTRSLEFCTTSRITSKTSSQIDCSVGGVFYGDQHVITYRDKYDRIASYTLQETIPKFCAWAQAHPGDPRLKGGRILGEGTSTRPYVICTVDHIKQIGYDADNNHPFNDKDIKGFFKLAADIDFTGVTDFKGIPAMQGNDFSFIGTKGHHSSYTISNLTIDNSASNEAAAFFLGCDQNTPLTERHIFNDVSFDNATIKTGTAKAAVVMLYNNCTSLNYRLLRDLSVTNSTIHANNTAGFIAAEYQSDSTSLGLYRLSVQNSELYSTRADGTTAVGGIFGKWTGPSVLPVSSILHISADTVLFKAAVGQSESGYNIGGLIGKATGGNNNIDADGRHIEIHDALGRGGALIGTVEEAPSLSISGQALTNTIHPKSNTSARFGGGIGYVTTSSNLNLNLHVATLVISNGNKLGGLVGELFKTGPGLHLEGFVHNGSLTTTGGHLGGAIGIIFQSGLDITDFKVRGLNLSGSTSLGGVIGNMRQTNLALNNIRIIDHSNITGATNGHQIGGLIGGSDQSYHLIENSLVAETSITGGDRVSGGIGRVDRANSFTARNNYIYNLLRSISGQNGVGGLVGSFTNTTTTPVFENNLVYSTVLAAGTSGSFIGAVDSSSMTPTFNNNYYRNDWSNGLNTNPVHEAVGEVEGKSAADLAIQATYVNWDFTNIWGMQNNKAALQSLMCTNCETKDY